MRGTYTPESLSFQIVTRSMVSWVKLNGKSMVFPAPSPRQNEITRILSPNTIGSGLLRASLTRMAAGPRGVVSETRIPFGKWWVEGISGKRESLFGTWDDGR